VSTEYLQKFSDATNAAKAIAVDTTERDSVVASAQLLIDEAHSLQTRLGILRAKHIDRVSEVHLSTDWPAVIAALPADWKYDTGSRTMKSKSRKAVQMFKAAAQNAHAALSSTLGDIERGPKDVDPVSLADAANCVELFLGTGRNSDMLIDPASRQPSGTFRRSLSHLREWLVRGRRIVASAVERVEAFDRAETFAKEVLEHAEPNEVKASPPPLRLDPLPDAPPSAAATSYTSFDPREFDANPMPVDEIVVEKVGANDGLRTRRAARRR
jgi:hypothetical protein